MDGVESTGQPDRCIWQSEIGPDLLTSNAAQRGTRLGHSGCLATKGTRDTLTADYPGRGVWERELSHKNRKFTKFYWPSPLSASSRPALQWLHDQLLPGHRLL